MPNNWAGIISCLLMANGNGTNSSFRAEQSDRNSFQASSLASQCDDHQMMPNLLLMDDTILKVGGDG